MPEINDDHLTDYDLVKKHNMCDAVSGEFVSISKTIVVICMLLQRRAWDVMNEHQNISIVKIKSMRGSKREYQRCRVNWIDCAEVEAEEWFLDRMRGAESPLLSVLSGSSVICQGIWFDQVFQRTRAASDCSRKCSVREEMRWIETH